MISFIIRKNDNNLPQVKSYYADGILQIYLKPHQIPYFDSFNNGDGVFCDTNRYREIISIEIMHSKDRWKIANHLQLPVLSEYYQAVVKSLPDITFPEEMYYSEKDSILLVRFPDVQINASFRVADRLIYSLDVRNRLAGIWLSDFDLNNTIGDVESWLHG